MKIFFSFVTILFLAACGNPGGISDQEYSQYKQLGAPKLLYSCTTRSEYPLASLMVKCLQGSSSSRECDKDALEASKTRVEIGYAAGVDSSATYNKLLTDTRKECGGKLEILESQQ